MKDFALSFQPDTLRADWTLAPPEVAMDGGLRSAVIISLFTDRMAEPDDVIPDGSDDRRGWWGDTPEPGEQADPIGSRLWLLAREKRTEETRRRAIVYAEEALAWLVQDGVAVRVAVDAQWQGLAQDQLALRVEVFRRDNGKTASEVFGMYWQQEAAR